MKFVFGLVLGVFSTTVFAAEEAANLQSTLDILWLAVSAALVFFMQAGFCFVETGAIRKKNTLNVAVKNIADMMIAIIAFWAIGYAVMFGNTISGLFGLGDFMLNGVSEPYDLMFFLFQAMFAGTAATIVSGAVAERMSFNGYLYLSGALAACIYPTVGHWAWGGGWLADEGFIDFAGSTVVHGVGAWVALAGVIVLGPRLNRFNKDGSVNELLGHDLLLSTIGVMILWFGWFGFNGGSNLVADGAIATILVNTSLAAAAGGLINLTFAHYFCKKIQIERILNGVLGGLVAITAGCHLVDATNAIIIGAIGGLIAHYASWVMLYIMKLDDPVSAIPVHGFAGAWGTIAVAFFAPATALEQGMWAQVGTQVMGVVTVFMWSFFTGLVIFMIFKAMNLLRVSEEHEHIGLNVAEHGAKTSWLETMNVMNEIVKSGDLSRRADIEIGSEAGQVAETFNQLMDQFEVNIKLIKQTSMDVKSTSNSLLTFAEEMQARLAEQDMNTTVITGAIEDLRGQLDQVNDNANRVAESTIQADTEVGSTTTIISMADEAIQNMVRVIQEIADVLVSLSDKAEDVGDITEVISGIAEQTNLLALNAAIEAARAGDAGRGFAVVAQEVRNLATRTKDSTLEIGALINQLQAFTEQAKQTVENGRTQAETSSGAIQVSSMAFSAVVESVKSMKEVNQSLVETIKRQMDATQLVHNSVIEIGEIASQSNQGITNLIAMEKDMDQSIHQIEGLVSQYKVVH
jgi:Amt family ammonium transporter